MADNAIGDGRRLRVLWFSHVVPYPPKGGVLMRSYHLLKQVSKYHEVDLLSFNQSGLLQEYFPSNEAGKTAAIEHLSTFVRNIHIEPIPMEGRANGQLMLALRSLMTSKPYTINWLVSARMREVLSSWVEKENYDLVHFDTESLAPYAGVTLPIPTIMDHHNVESHMLIRRAKQEPNILKRCYYWQEGHRLARYERQVLDRFDHQIVCSSDDRDRLLQINNALSISVVPNGIETAENFPDRASRPARRLLFVGGLDWYPNRDAMLYFFNEVWPLISARSEEVFVDIVGKRPGEELLAFAKGDSRITIHGFVDDISRFYRDAAVYICPIRNGGGTKLKVLDALAHRVPLVAHPIACEGIEVKDGVHVLMSSEPEDMARNICQLLSDPERAQRLGDAGYELMRREYDFREVGRNLAELYCDVAMNRSLDRVSSTE